MDDQESYVEKLETLLERALTAGEEIKTQLDHVRGEIVRLTEIVDKQELYIQNIEETNRLYSIEASKTKKDIEELRAENERLKDAAEGMALLFIKS